MEPILFKRGDTFRIPELVFWLDKTAQTPQPLTNVTIKSQLRKGSILVATLTPVVTDSSAGKFYLYFNGSTEEWPVGIYTSDIEFTMSDGTIMSTKTFSYECEKDETRNV